MTPCRLIVFLSLLLPMGNAHANLDVHPMRIHVDVERASSLRVHSQTSRPQYVRVTVKRVVDAATDHEREVEEPPGEQSALAVTPTRFALAGGGSRLVRAIALTPVAQETAFRLYFEAVPGPEESALDVPVGTASATIGVSLVWGALVNVLPAGGDAMLQVQGGHLRNHGTLRAGVLRLEHCAPGQACATHAVERSIYPGGSIALPFQPQPGARITVHYRLTREGYREHREVLQADTGTGGLSEVPDRRGGRSAGSAVLAGVVAGMGSAAALRDRRRTCLGPACAAQAVPDMSPHVAANGEQIARNRGDIAALNARLSGLVPDPGDVLRIDKDHQVQLRGARLVQMGSGAVTPTSHDAVTGAQLHGTQQRIVVLEDASRYVKVGADSESRPVQVGSLASAFGSDASAPAEGATAIGSFAHARARNAVALGRGALVTLGAPEGFALGPRARVSAESGVALGASAQVWEGAENSVALGYQSLSTRPWEVSVGGQGLRRRIAHVAPGVDPDDAVTVRQLDAVRSGLDRRMQGLEAHTAGGDLAVQPAPAAETASAAPGHDVPTRPPADLPVDTRAVDAAVQRAAAYTDQALVGVQRELQQLDRRLNRMAAMGSAQAAMAMNTAGLPSANRLGAGVGHVEGESALAMGYQRVLNLRAPATISLNGAFSDGGERSVAMGVGIGW